MEGQGRGVVLQLLKLADIRLDVYKRQGHVRTHVDVTDPKLIAMTAMLELREELKDEVNIQIVAFPQEGILSFPNGKELMENAAKMGCDVIGAIPVSYTHLYMGRTNLPKNPPQQAVRNLGPLAESFLHLR